MGAKRDFKAAPTMTNGNATAPVKKEKPEVSVDTVPARDYRDDVIEDLNSDLRKLQKLLTCVICLDMLFEPYSLQCGHVFCYTCMLDWLGQQKKMTCPECRDTVKVRPAPAYLIREMTETFVNRSELTSPHGSGAELRKQQREALKAVERDKANEGKGDKGGLFHGMFKKRKKLLRAMRDPEDGVLRCPGCNWEVEDGYCHHCGRRVRTEFHHGEGFWDEDEEGDDSGSETESDREDDEIDFGEDLDEEEDEEDFVDENFHMRRPRYVFNLQDHDNDNDDEDDDEDDGARGLRNSSVSTAGGRNEPINLDDDSDISLQIAYPNRRGVPPMRTSRRPPAGVITQAREQPRTGRHAIQESSEIEEESEDDEDEGSLADFVEHDTPENRRRLTHGRNGGGLRGFQNNSPMVISSSPAIAAPIRRNARRTVLDDDEENQSSVSEASSRPPPFRGEIRHDYTQRRGPIALPSDNDDDDVELLGPDMGYTPLDYTASENEDDVFMSPPARRGQMGPVSHPSGPGSVFSVPEEDEEDEESRTFGDDDESEDEDGDVRMGNDERRGARGGPRPRPNGQRTLRNRTRASRPQVVEDEDSDSDSDVAPVTRRRRIQATGARGSNYFRAHHRDPSGGNRQANSGRRQREIDPAFLNMFRQHGQAISERQLGGLGAVNPGVVSPARSATPVQRHYTGGSSRGPRSTRESTREPVREVTPVQAMRQSSPPPPFSPMFQGISSSPASMAPISSAPNNPQSPPQVQSPRLGAGSGSSNNQAWNTLSPSPQAPRPVPITIGVSPQASRVRSRNSRQQLRGSSSRLGLRVGSVTPTPTSPQSVQLSQGGMSAAAILGRQQGAGPVLTAAASRGRRGVALTTEDIRARGEAAVRRRQQEAAEAASSGALGRRSSRRDLSVNINNSSANAVPTPLTVASRTGTGNFPSAGRRLGAVIGGTPGQGAGGGPMLVIGGSEDD